MLINSLKRKHDLNDKDASRMIEEFVEDTKRKLSKNKYCKLDGIGYLLNHNGSLKLIDTFCKHSKYPTLSPMVV